MEARRKAIITKRFLIAYINVEKLNASIAKTRLVPTSWLDKHNNMAFKQSRATEAKA